MQETIGYKASKEMEELLYKDSGIYKYKQVNKAEIVTLKSAYEEIGIYWDQDVKFRPGFSVDADTAKLPVFFSKINGITENRFNYWKSIKDLMTKKSILVKKYNIIKLGFFKKLKYRFIACFDKNKLNLERLVRLKDYKYCTLPKPMQDHLLKCIYDIIQNKIFKGTFEYGVEKTIVAVFLSLPSNIMKLIHNFDFTGKNPKLIYISAENVVIPIEDAIILVLLHYIGLDVIIFTPNGTNCMGQYLNEDIINEYQIGNNVENVHVPNFIFVNSFL